MTIHDFTRSVLLNRCLREGGFAGPRKCGSETNLWQSLSMLEPQQLENGLWRGDAMYFFDTPVHSPLMMLQSTLRDLSREYDVVPEKGESFVKSFIPRVVSAVANKKRQSMGDTVEMDAVHTAMITPLDADGLRQLMLSVFELKDDTTEYQDEVLAHTGQIVFEKFMSDAYDRLTTGDQESLELLVEKTEDPAEVLEFLEARLSDFDSLLAGQVLAIKSEYDSIAGKIAKMPIKNPAPDIFNDTDNDN